MNNKFNTLKYNYHHPPTLAHTLERQNYNRVLLKLNEQNEYLSHNMKQLIMENLALKNKLYHQTDSTYRAKDYAKDYAKYDVEQSVKRTEYGNHQKYNQHKKLKTQESMEKKSRPRTYKMPANRQSEKQSVIKRPTIIEGLSESQFENEGEKNKSHNGQGKKGILLSKQVKKKQEQKRNQEQYQRQQQQQRQVEQEKHKRKFEDKNQLNEEEQFTPKKTESQINDNPEKHEEKKPSKHKKDNSPYLKATNPYVGTYTTTYTPSKISKMSTFNNRTYLDYSAK